jgi:putative pyruvate formate lyase activating enzyme
MHRQVGPLRFNEEGLARRGLLVRYLVMPGQTEEAAAIFKWLAEEVSPDTYVNIMDQYRPDYSVAEEGSGGKYAAIARRPMTQEVGLVSSLANRVGLWRLDER